jgi:hypothetical protein
MHMQRVKGAYVFFYYISHNRLMAYINRAFVGPHLNQTIGSHCSVSCSSLATASYYIFDFPATSVHHHVIGFSSS